MLILPTGEGLLVDTEDGQVQLIKAQTGYQVVERGTKSIIIQSITKAYSDFRELAEQNTYTVPDQLRFHKTEK